MTKPMFDAPGASEAIAVDAQPETHSKPVSDAARTNDLSIASLVFACGTLLS
jgi:hypothetical protein